MSLKEKVHPNIWLKGDKEDIILYALSAQGPLNPSDFIRDGNHPNNIQKTTFYKYFKNLLEKKYVYTKLDEKDRKKVKYFITGAGEIHLSKRSFLYGLDYETRLKMEIRRSKNLTNRLQVFFQENRIKDEQLKIEYINLASIITFEKSSKLFFEESKFNKLLLFLVLNHPKFYPRLTISIESFIEKYNNISDGFLTLHEIGLFLERLIENTEYDVNFHKINVPSEEIELFFSEISEYGKIFEFVIDDKLKNFMHKTNLGIIDFNQGELAKTYHEIIFTLVDKYQLFHPNLKDGLYNLIDNFRKKIKEDLIKSTSEYIEYARVIELPDMAKEMKPLAIKPSRVEETFYYPKKPKPTEDLKVSSSSFKDLKYFSKDKLIKKAWDLYDKKEFEGTLEQLNKVLEIEENPELYYWKAEILGSAPLKRSKKAIKQAREEALDTIEKGIKLDIMPSGFNFFRLKADVLNNLSNYELALESINKALEIDDQEKIFEMKCNILFNLGRIDECVELTEKSHSLSRQYLIDLLYKIAIHLFFEHNYEKALSIVDKIIEIDPNHPNTLLLKSKLLIIFQKNDQASKIVDNLKSLDYKSVNFVELANILSKLERHDESLEFIEKAMIQEEYFHKIEGPYIYYTYALILKKFHRYEEALIAIKKFGAMELSYYIHKSEILINLERYDDALEEINYYLEYTVGYNPDELYSQEVIDLYRRKIDLLIILKKPNDIIKFLTLDVNKEQWWIYYYAVRQSIEYNESIIAKKIVKSLLEIYPKDIAALSDNIGKGYYHEILYQLIKRNYDKSLELISRYYRFNDSDSQIIKLKIETLRQLRKYNEALEVVNNAIKKWPKEPKLITGDLFDKETLSKGEETEASYQYEFCRIKAIVLLSMNKQEDALEIIEKVIKLNPELAEVYVIKTYILASSEKYDEAIFQINKAIEINPKEPNYFRIRSSILHKYFRQDEALDAISKAIHIDPKNPTDYSIKARILISLENPQEALKTINKGIELFPEYLGFYEIRNLIFNILGKSEEALDGIEKALMLGAKYQGIYYEKGQILTSLNKYSVALDTIDKKLESNPNDRTISLKILILTEVEKCDEALEVLENNKELIHKDDSKSDSYNNLKAQIFYTKGKLFAKNNMRKEAIDLIEAALELTDSEKADNVYKFGEILMILHDYKAASKKFKYALMLISPPLDTQIKLGQCYFEIGQYDDALKNLEKGKYQAEYGIKKIEVTEDGERVEKYFPQTKLIIESNKIIKEINSLLLEIKLASIKTEIYFNIGDLYVSNGKYDLAMKYFQQGREFAAQRKEDIWIKKANNEIKRYNSFIEDLRR